MREGDGSGRVAESRSVRTATKIPRQGRGRISPSDLLAFRRALDATTRRAVVTPLIVLACGATFVAMAATGVPILWPYASHLVDWGANDGARVILRDEYWRLAASVFVHGGLVHLAVNMWSLLVIGPLVERIYGHLAFAALYLAAGIGGAITSAAVPPVRVSVGASGAICGVLGGLLAFLVLHRRTIPPTVLHQLRRNVLGVVLFMAVLGALVPNIDQAAHLGGLAVGFASGLLLIGPWPVAPGGQRRLLARRVAMIVAIAGALAGSAGVLAHRGDAVIPPARRLDDLTEQLAPIVREFSSIRGDLSPLLKYLDGTEGAAERRSVRATIRDLRARAVANATRLNHVQSSHPDLQAIQASLVRALAGQVDRLDALQRYLETGDPTELDMARDARAATIEATQLCEELQDRYLTRHGLIPQFRPGQSDR
jgi:rhomboid protease GluP